MQVSKSLGAQYLYVDTGRVRRLHPGAGRLSREQPTGATSADQGVGPGEQRAQPVWAAKRGLMTFAPRRTNADAVGLLSTEG